jgi:hypothetical protein
MLLVLSVAYSAQAQNETDVVRYTQYSNLSTARSVGLGGALGALGADFSVMSTNPAGLAWYRKSVFEITPTMTNVEVNSLLNNEKSNTVWRETKDKFGLPNIGFVRTMHRPGTSIPTFNFGIGLNQLADFNRNFYFEGDSKGSIVNRFQELANGSDGFDDFESGVAFDAEALYDDPQDGYYESDFDVYPDALVNKEQAVKTTGGVKEFVVGMAGNFNEKFLFGLSLGFPIVNFSEEKIYKETDTGEGDVGNVPVFDDLEYTEYLETTGGGVNMKLGFIYRASQALRFGVAIHTPTLYDLTDREYKTTMTYNYTLSDTPSEGYAESPTGSFIYALRTPWRFIGSGAYILGKKGLVSADLEYLNYSKAELIYDGFIEEERDANQLISNNLTSAINLRVGGEVVLNMFRLRGGIEFSQSPVEGDNTVRTGYSFGGGVRGRVVFLDVAYKRSISKETYIPYRTYEAPTQNVDNDNIVGNIVATIGFRF